jgi:hypothetical protein
VKHNLLLLVVAAVLVLGTLVSFLWQNLSELVPTGHTVFPFRTAVVSPWEYPTEWSLPLLLLDIALVWGGLRLILAAIAGTRHRRAPPASTTAGNPKFRSL